MKGVIYVALGGALGAVCRYGISLIPCKTEFPVLTLVTNLLGALLIGFIVGIASGSKTISDNGVLLLKTGVCGGFTTFSTFSLEAWRLLECGKAGLAAGYAVLSVIGCVVGVAAGIALSKAFIR